MIIADPIRWTMRITDPIKFKIDHGVTDQLRYNIDHGNSRSYRVTDGPWE